MALIKNISPLRLVVAGSGALGTALVSRAVDLEKRFPGKIKLIGVVLPNGEKTMAAGVAREHGSAVWRDGVTSPAFASTLLHQWQPEIIYTAGYSEKFPTALTDSARLGGYNIHPCTEGAWPSYNVEAPLQAMLDAHESAVILALHEMDEGDVVGDLIATSKPYAISDVDNAASLDRKIADEAGWMMEAHMGRYMGLPQQAYLERGYVEAPRRAASA